MKRIFLLLGFFCSIISTTNAQVLKRIDQLPARAAAHDTDLMFVGNPTGGRLFKMPVAVLETRIIDSLNNSPFLLKDILAAAFGEATGVPANTTGYGQITGRSSTFLPEIDVQFIISNNCTINSLYVATANSQPVDDSLFITLRVNGANTALSVTIPAGTSSGTFSDLVNTVSISAGDLIDWQFVNASSSTSAKIISVGAILTGTD